MNRLTAEVVVVRVVRHADLVLVVLQGEVIIMMNMRAVGLEEEGAEPTMKRDAGAEVMNDPRVGEEMEEEQEQEMVLVESVESVSDQMIEVMEAGLAQKQLTLESPAMGFDACT